MPDLELKVTAIKELTPSIKLFELVRAVGGELPPFQAGAHIDIRTGNGLIRSYSLANDPTDRDRYVTAVLREPNGGGGSKWMHDDLKVGDVVTSSEPLQNFPLNERAPLSILLAGGGIQGGRVIGKTDRSGGVPADRPVHVQEVFATLYRNLGIDVNRVTVRDLSGRPHYLVDADRKPISELYS